MSTNNQLNLGSVVSAVVITSATGTVLSATTLPTGLTIPNPTIVDVTTQKVYDHTYVLQVFEYTGVASSVNYLDAINAVTGSAPSLSVLGADSNIGLNLATKGSGVFTLNGNLFYDVNKNITANSFLTGYATTATAASTTTLTVASSYLQFFTGTTTQTVLLPVTSTLVLGQPFEVVNNSTGVITVQSSGGNTIQAMAAGTTAIFNCILLSGTSAASWSVTYISAGGGSSPWTAGGGTGSALGGDGTSVASGNYSLSYGSATNTVSGASSIGFGHGNLVEADNSYAIGYFHHIHTAGNFSFVAGYACGMLGQKSVAMGNSCSVNTGGNGSFALGTSCLVQAASGFALGTGATATQQGSFVWNDSTSTANNDTAQDQWVITANGGFYQYSGTKLLAQYTSAGSILIGTNKNDSAASGYIGEYISSTVTYASPVTITSTNISQDITSISLTAGDWDVWGSVGTVSAGTTTTSSAGGWTSTTSATQPSYPNNGSMFSLDGITAGGSHNILMPTGVQRISIASTTTVYLSAFVSFAVSTMQACGFIGARRVR